MALLATLALAAAANAAEIDGTPGADRLGGGAGRDAIDGRGGADVIVGRGGFDRLRGGRGPDRIIGGPGRDRLIGGPGRDEFNTGPGGHVTGADGVDRIRARDRAPDQIQCGPGFDVVVVDWIEDGIFDCERILEPAS
jgi:Ca2+-binding RTX toxin-like protein